MSDQYLGEIRLFAGNYAPNGWAFCNGQVLPVSQFPALFTILGSTYGGNGVTTFALPNLSGATPLQAGQGLGLSNYELGESGGVASVTLRREQLPAHCHTAQGVNGGVEFTTPAEDSRTEGPYGPATNTIATIPQPFQMSGNGQAHNNLPPFLGLNFIIALQGEFPSRG